MSLKFDLSTAESAFNKLPKSENGSISVEDLKVFMEKYLEGAGDDMVYVEPVDFVPEPEGFLPKVENAEVRTWALEVHALWKNLSRKVSDEVLKRPELHTLLPLPKPVVIPGSRFREVYYWDSYWIIRGLLASKMYETAKAIVTNLIHLIEEYGHVLNGTRAYCTNRRASQLVKRSLPSLVKEHHFWSSEIHKVTIQDAQSYNHTLNRYYAMWNQPRPESSTIDKQSASKITNISEKQNFYREVASTAESGWDFSTRWMSNHSDLTTLATASVLPVDLNAFILRSTAEHFLKGSQARMKAFKSIFWNSEMGQWLDYWLNDSTCQEPQNWEACNQNQNVCLLMSTGKPGLGSQRDQRMQLAVQAQLIGLDTALVKKVMKSFQSSGLLFPAGIATSLANSGQQWDFPNGWAPLQHMIAEGLARSGSKEARSVAEDIAVRWLRTNYVAYKKTGTMHEKYDVEKCGEFGGGGEYAPQTGFGWSNGVVLAFLEEFGWPQDRKIHC
ncbi:hypothetical protein CIPAW_11G115500 [Carya illinoinensis]|uniref:Alpha,alpha-trehalose glucohydrolase n=1 Tax=Carya illinoinensis TaxID=32201 RepID=A0A8T1P6K5_CARIL|nr:hypothetical protein CIPAW_11G115500 [Carya illinoinensis]